MQQAAGSLTQRREGRFDTANGNIRNSITVVNTQHKNTAQRETPHYCDRSLRSARRACSYQYALWWTREINIHIRADGLETLYEHMCELAQK